MSDKPATGPTLPYNPENFAQETELRSPSEVAKAAARKGAELRLNQARLNYPTPQGIFVQLAGMSHDPLISQSDFAAFEKHRANYNRLNGEIADVTQDKAKEQYRLDRAALEKAMADGSHSQNNPQDSWSIDDYRSDFANRMRAAKNARRIVEGEASAIVGKVLPRLADWAEEVGNNVEQSDRVEFAKFAVPYVESPLCATIRAAAAKLRQPVWAMQAFGSFVEEVILTTGAKHKKGKK